jgi:uncharacterized protein YbjT (DUF2867 family)
MKVLITTPNGKVGQHIAQTLLDKQIPVRIAAHTVSKAQAAFPGAEVVAFDYHDAASVEAALVGVTHLYLAAPGDYPGELGKRVIDLAQAQGVKCVVYLSAMGVENADESVPLRQVEKHLEASPLEWTILRPTWFMQNYATGQAASVKNGVVAEPADDATTAFIDARDIAAVAVEALLNEGHHGQHYALTGAELLTRHQVAEQLGQALGKPVQYIPLTDEAFRQAMQTYLSPVYLELLSNLYAGVRAGWSSVKTETVKQVLGRDPIPFQQFAHDHRAAWQ